MVDTLEGVIECDIGERVDFKCLVKDKSLGKKRNDEPFLNITVQDKEYDMTFPVWDKVEERKEAINKGDLIRVVGVAKEYMGNKQVDVRGFEKLEEDKDEYIPVYEVPDELVDEFNEIVESLSSPYREFVQKILSEKYPMEEFLSCVAAEHGHQNKRGGLFLHTIGVVKNVINFLDLYVDSPFFQDANNVISKDRVISSSILHDLGKIDEYEYKDGIFRKDNVLDHRVSMVGVIETFGKKVSMDGEDIYRIQRGVLGHHGPWGAYQPEHIEDTLVHLADMVDSKVVQCSEKEDPQYRINFGMDGMINAIKK